MLDIHVDAKKEIVVISISGDLFIESLKYFEIIWDEQVSKKPAIIAFDCKNLNKIDSSAIASLVYYLKNAMLNHIHLVLYDINTGIQRVLDTAKLNSFFTITTRKEFVKEYPGAA